MESRFIQRNIYPIWKPKNITSSDVVRRVKKIYSLEKAGHCGTLDPFAEGVLVIVSNESTQLSEEFMKKIKTYLATISLGTQTDTLDSTGEILYKDSCNNFSFNKALIIKTLETFIGRTKQRPPCFSAKRVNGVRLYTLARKDIFVHLKAVEIKIEDIKLVSFNGNELIIEVCCHKGVYIRQLGLDIAKSLGTIGYLKSLTRTKLGDFSELNTIKLNELVN